MREYILLRQEQKSRRPLFEPDHFGEWVVNQGLEFSEEELDAAVFELVNEGKLKVHVNLDVGNVTLAF